MRLFFEEQRKGFRFRLSLSTGNCKATYLTAVKIEAVCKFDIFVNLRGLVIPRLGCGWQPSYSC